MAVSKLEIFKTEILPERNALVDNLDSYLRSLYPTYTNDSYQYQKIELDMELKVTLPQDIFQYKSIGNYVRLKQDGRTFYLFIMGYDWISQNAVLLHCKLDTLNTFRDDLVGKWTNKTYIKRKHVDRYKIARYNFTTDPNEITVNGTNNPYTWEVQYEDPTLKNCYLDEEALSSIKMQLEIKSGQGTVEIMEARINPKLGLFVALLDVNVTEPKFVANVSFDVLAKFIGAFIDPTPEGINPELYGHDIGPLIDNDMDNNWYVIYNTPKAPEGTATEKQSVETLLCTDKAITANVKSKTARDVTLTPNDLEEGITYFIDARNPVTEDNFKFQLVQAKLPTSNTTLTTNYNSTAVSISGLIGKRDTIIFRKVSGASGYVIEARGIRFSKLFGVWRAARTGEKLTGNSITLQAATDFVIQKGNGPFNPDELASSPSVTKYYSSEYLSVPEGRDNFIEIAGINDLTKSLASLIKIIKLPYCPIGYSIDNYDNYIFENLLEEATTGETGLNVTLLRIPENVEFNNHLNLTVPNIMEDYRTHVDINDSRFGNPNINYDPKILDPKLKHSEFYQPKIVYDSFSKSFDLEKMYTIQNNAVHLEGTLQVDYKPSRLFNSSFMFTFPEYITRDDIWEGWDSSANKPITRPYGLNTQDYNNILIINRNNEMPIYSNAYLDYVRNGYNYDVKAKNQKNTMNWIGTGLNMAHGAAGMLTGTDWMSSDGITNTIGSIVNNVASSIESERNLNQKLADTNSRATSVSNADSIDLLQEYSGNKAKLVVYNPSYKTMRNINDLFYYTGYKIDDRENWSICDLSLSYSRWWFDYVQGNPEFRGITDVYVDFIDDIKQRYNEGVTIYHKHTTTSTDGIETPVYDWEQEKENWEVRIVNEIHPELR